MTYGWVRDFALKLIDQYSVAGEKVELAYNNQADYVTKIPALVNDGLELLFTAYRLVKASAPLDTLGRVKFGDVTAYVLPDDLWQVCSAGMVYFDEDGRIGRYGGFHLLEEKMFVLDGDHPSDLFVEYYRHPHATGENPRDGEELDGPVEMHMVLPFYVAAHLAMHDNAYTYQALYNEFESRAQKLIEVPKAELGITEDAYSFGWAGGM